MIVNKLVTKLSFAVDEAKLKEWQSKAEKFAKKIADFKEKVNKKVHDVEKTSIDKTDKLNEKASKNQEKRKELYTKLFLKLSEKEAKEVERIAKQQEASNNKALSNRQRQTELANKIMLRAEEKRAREVERLATKQARDEQKNIERGMRFREQASRYIERVQIRNARNEENLRIRHEREEMRRIDRLAQYQERRAREVNARIERAMQNMHQRGLANSDNAMKNKAIASGVLANGSGRIASSSFDFAKDLVTNFGEIEAQRNSTQAFGGLNDIEIRKLNAQIQLIAENSRYTPLDITTSAKEMTKQGYKGKALETFLPASLDFATATEATPMQSQELLASMMHTFGITNIKDVGGVSDTLTAGLNESALNFDDFKYSLQYMAPASMSTGGNLKSTTAFLALLSQAGLKGTSAGTSGRKMVTDIATEFGGMSDNDTSNNGKKKKRKETLFSMGVNESDSYSTTVNKKTGKEEKFFDISKTLLVLSEKLKTKTPFERTAILKDIFGRTAQNAAALIGIIGQKNPEEFARIKKAIYNPDGATDRGVKARNKGVDYETKTTQSKFMGVMNDFGETIAPFATVALKAFKLLLGYIKNLSPGVKSLIAGFILAVPIVTGLLAVFLGFKAFLAILALLKIATFAISTVMGLGGMLGVAIGLGIELGKLWDKNKSVWTNIKNIISNVVGGAKQLFVEFFDYIYNKFQSMASWIPSFNMSSIFGGGVAPAGVGMGGGGNTHVNFNVNAQGHNNPHAVKNSVKQGVGSSVDAFRNYTNQKSRIMQ